MKRRSVLTSVGVGLLGGVAGTTGTVTATGDATVGSRRLTEKWTQMLEWGVEGQIARGGDDVHLTPGVDGGYLIAGGGYASDAERQRPEERVDWLAKIGYDGTLEWQREYDAPDSSTFGITDVVTADDGYVAVGVNGDREGYVRGFDASGSVAWTSWLDESIHWPTAATRTRDGRIAVVGFTTDGVNSYNPYLARVSREGDIEWEDPVPVEPGMRVDDVAEGPDGSLYLVGSDRSADERFIAVVKVGPDGSAEWWDRPVVTDQTVFARAIHVRGDGTVVATGRLGGEERVAVLHAYEPDGTHAWAADPDDTIRDLSAVVEHGDRLLVGGTDETLQPETFLGWYDGEGRNRDRKVMGEDTFKTVSSLRVVDGDVLVAGRWYDEAAEQPGAYLRKIDVQRATPPTASLIVRTEDAVAGEEVVLEASDSTDPNGDALEYRWRIDDDPVDLDGATVSHVFDDAGEHEVQVTVVDETGLSDVARTTVAVDEPAIFAVTDFTPESVTVQPGETFEVTAAVENAGGRSGTRNVQIYIADEVIHDRELSLEAGEAETVAADVDPSDVDTGEYEYGVRTGDDTRSGTVVVEAAEGDSGLPGPGVPGALTALAGAGYALRRRAGEDAED